VRRERQVTKNVTANLDSLRSTRANSTYWYLIFRWLVKNDLSAIN
jgi:hypothetical protein